MHLDSTPLPVAESTVQFTVADQRPSGAGASSYSLPANGSPVALGGVQVPIYYHSPHKLYLEPFGGFPSTVPAPSHPPKYHGRLIDLAALTNKPVQAAEAALGLYTKSAAAPAARRFELQEAIAMLLPGWRVSFCGKAPVPPSEGDPIMVKVLRHVESGHASFGALARCGSVWICPSCAARLAELRRAELQRAIDAWVARGGVVYMATYTFRHKRKDRLRDLLYEFGEAQRSMTGARDYKAIRSAYGIKHSIKALEVTYGWSNGWHVHSHWLLFGERPLLGGGVDELKRSLYAAWGAACGRKGLETSEAHGVDVQSTEGAIADYIAKWGHDPGEDKRPWGPEDELAKSASKTAGKGTRYTPWDLAREYAKTGSQHFAELFVEYALHFHGKRQLVWSRGAKLALLGEVELTEAEQAAELEQLDLHPQLETVATLFEYEWLAVLHYKARAQLLAVAGSGDRVATRAYVAALVRRAELDRVASVVRSRVEYMRLFTEAVT